MNKHKLTASIALILFIIGGVTAQQQQQATTASQAERLSSSTLTMSVVNTDPYPLQSGEQGDLRLQIRNKGSSSAQNVEVTLLDNYPFEIKPDRQRSFEFGEMVQGQEYQIPTEVLVAEDAPDGSNTFRARVVTDNMKRTLEIPVEVQSQDIELNIANLQTEPGTLMPDTDNNQINIDIVNNGEKTAENVVLNLKTPEFFEKTSSFSTRKALGNVAPGERKTASFTLDLNESTPSGMTTFETVTTYSADDSTGVIEQTDSFQLSIEGKPQFQVNKVEGDLRTGSTGKIRLEVVNSGDVESASTRIRVMDSSDQPFTYDSSSQYIGTLEAGETGETVFNVETDSDAEIKDYLIDFEVRGVKDTEVFVEDETVETSVSSGETEDDGLPLPLIAVLAVVALLFVLFRNKIKNVFSSEEENQTEE